MACSSSDKLGPATGADGGNGYSSPVYVDPSMWLCGNGAPHDYCLDSQTATEIHADNSQSDVAMPRAKNPAVDCFYVYPTVDLTGPAGNRQDFDNVDFILDPLLSQAAVFAQVCTVYAPFYHQATLPSYSDPNKATYLDTAYQDVEDAFRHFIGQLSHGRNFVLLGHSQGTHMLRRLIQRQIEKSDDLKSRMTLAILAGNTGDVVVPPGEVVGGTFATTPLCTSPTERGCVITYNTYAQGYPPVLASERTDPSMNVACANPGALAGGLARTSGSFFPTKIHNSVIDPGVNFGVTTNFAVYRYFFTTECKTMSAGLTYLELAPAPQAGDARTNPIPFTAPLFSAGAPYFLGLHLIDLTFPMQDMLGAVSSRSTKP